MSTAPSPRLRAAGRSHPGLRRPNNEDRYSIVDAPAAGRASILAVIADGIGGHQAGEVAAELAIETIVQKVAASNGKHPSKTLGQAFMEANRRINQAAGAQDSRHGMGTTCVAAWVLGERLYTASLGDSRLYLLRDGELRQLTTDHTWVQEAIEAGALLPEQAKGHPNAHIVRRYLGSPRTEQPDFRIRMDASESDRQAESHQGMPLRTGDRLLLCTDGLTDLVSNAEIAEILRMPDLDVVLDTLIERANARGGRDNITAVVLEAEDIPAPPPDDAPPDTPPNEKTRRDMLLFGGFAALFVLGLCALTVLAVLGTYLWLRP